MAVPPSSGTAEAAHEGCPHNGAPFCEQVVNHAEAPALGARFAPLLMRAPQGRASAAHAERAAAAITLLIRDYRSLFMAAVGPALIPPRPEGAPASLQRGAPYCGVSGGSGPGSGGNGGCGLAAQMAGRITAQLALHDCENGGGACPMGAAAGYPTGASAALGATSLGGRLAAGAVSQGSSAAALDRGNPTSGTGGNATPRHRTRAEADEIWAAAAAAEAAWAAGDGDEGAEPSAWATESAVREVDSGVREADIDCLLSGSLEAVLFELDDAAFRAAAYPSPSQGFGGAPGGGAALRCAASAPGDDVTNPTPNPSPDPSWPTSPESSAGSGSSSWGAASSASFPPGAFFGISPRTVVPGAAETLTEAGHAIDALGCPGAAGGGVSAAMLASGGTVAPGASSAWIGVGGCEGALEARVSGWQDLGVGSAPKRRLSDEAKVRLFHSQFCLLHV